MGSAPADAPVERLRLNPPPGPPRIESGQHRTSTDTLRRLAEALDGHAVVGFQFDTAQPAQPELVRL